MKKYFLKVINEEPLSNVELSELKGGASCTCNGSYIFTCSCNTTMSDCTCNNGTFPICDGGCSLYRYRNLFKGCKYEICSPYKDIENLKTALLSKEIHTH